MLTKRRVIDFDFDWEFYKGDMPIDEFSSKNDLRRVKLPHDFSMETAPDKENPSSNRGGFFETGICLYKKHFNFEDLMDKRIYINFDGVYMNSDVYINGYFLGHRPNGYAPFTYEITDYVCEGGNLIVVRCDNSLVHSQRWYTGTGIYRHAKLIITSKEHMVLYRTVVKSETTDNISNVKIDVQVANLCDKHLSFDVYDFRNNLVFEKVTKEKNVEFTIENPLLWDIDCPNLYSVHIKLLENDIVLDDEYIKFGIKKTEYSPEFGFKLNGRVIKIQGVCLHSDCGVVGMAVPDKLWEKRLHMLKEMGCNAVRTAHNPMASEFYDMCDEIGILVMSEFFDGWDVEKSKSGYHLYFEDWWEKDLEDMLYRDINHPSIFMWSIGNEIPGNEKSRIAKMLVDKIKTIDNTRPTTAGICDVSEDAFRIRDACDVLGCNDGLGSCFMYEKMHKKSPEKVIVATEAPHTYQTRGVYQTQTCWRFKNQPRIEIENLTEKELFRARSRNYSSSYDNDGLKVCARESHKIANKYPYMIGEFRWTGFDYYGENNNGWDAVLTSYGIIDTANFKTDHYYFYKSVYTKKPMIHILPHWTHDFEEGTIVPVFVYTNCHEAELIINGKSLGKKPMTSDLYIPFEVPYEKGELVAIGYKNSVRAASVCVKTNEGEQCLILDCDDNWLKNDCRDIAIVNFGIYDRNMVLAPFAYSNVCLTVLGDGKLLGMENGDPVNTSCRKTNVLAAFNGLGMGIVESTFENCNISVLGFGILGKKYFCIEREITLSYDEIALRGELSKKEYDVFYKIGEGEFIQYEKPFKIYEDAEICAKVVLDGEEVCRLSSGFVRGEEPFEDIEGDRNYNLNLKQYSNRAIDERFLGRYYNNFDYVFEFCNDNRCLRTVGNLIEVIGMWWKEDNGDVKFVMKSGEISTIRLINENSDIFLPEHNGYWGEESLIWKRIIEEI